jgi:hypothetical protein
MTMNRVLSVMYGLSIGWIGIVLPLKVLASLWRFWSFPGFWDEIIALCFLVALSVGLLVGLFRDVAIERSPR